MKYKFPDGYLWGTSTAAAQIETASDHNWKGVKSNDGYIFEETAEHEKRRYEDLEYICKFGTVYRCGVDWARLQTEAFEDFDEAVVKEYQDFFQALVDRKMKVLFVLHHFMQPNWFEKNGGWENNQNIPAFIDYARQCVYYFGRFVWSWNTFNEPNVFAFNGYLAGDFPPFKKSFFAMRKVLKHMGKAHHLLYEFIHQQIPDAIVGISLNTCWFDGKTFFGKIQAKISARLFHGYTESFFQDCDYWGMSYYAYFPFIPKRIDEITSPGRLAELGYEHDKMWAYRPEGMYRNIIRLHNKYKKPILITESGVCTEDDDIRIKAINDYSLQCYKAIEEGVDMMGYIFWSTLDNFEWNLGPTYRFGLVQVDLKTKDRTMTRAGEYYEKITKANCIEIPD